jgi:hypothetical protein
LAPHAFAAQMLDDGLAQARGQWPVAKQLDEIG